MAGGRSDVWSRRITIVLTHFMRVFGKHWLAFANVALALYITLPVLAPVLIHAGHERAGNAIHLVFRPLCHQMPERSFFLYGEAPYYTLSELEEDLDGLVPLRYKGDDVHGYKIAICQRCTAIYGTMLIAGLAFNRAEALAQAAIAARFWRSADTDGRGWHRTARWALDQLVEESSQSPGRCSAWP